MAKYKISQEREQCISCGACVSVCPDNWKIDKDGKASPKKTDLDEISCNKDAAKQCPVNIIHIKESKTGKKII